MSATNLIASASLAVADWLTAVGTVSASVVALAFGLGLRDWWRRPRLRAVFDASAPADRILVQTAGPSKAVLRLRMRNEGRTAAKSVHVAITGVAAWAGLPGHWVEGKFDLHGRALVWSNSSDSATSVDMPPGGERYIDLIVIPRDWDHQGAIEMTLQIGPPTAGRSEQLSPGAWLMALEISADDVSAVTRYVAVAFNGVWPADSDRVWNEIAVSGPSSTRPTNPPSPENLTAEEQIAQAVEQDAAAEQ